MEGDERERGHDEVKRLERRVENVKAVCGYLEDLITTIHEKEHDESSAQTPAESGRYPYVPSRRADFVEMLLAVKHLYGGAFNGRIECAHCGSEVITKRTFVDVGCGLADKVVLASKIGFEAHGIEVDPYLVRTVKEKYQFRECLDARCSRALPATSWNQETLTLYPVDAMTFDYSGFDVIYFYRPFQDPTLEVALEQRIWRQARPGAYVLSCMPATTPPPALGFEQITEVDEFEIPYAMYVRRRPAEEKDHAPEAPAKKRKRAR